MIYDNNFIKDFAARTKYNLDKLKDSPYEITQLINSIIGLLIIPEQKQYDKINDNLINTELLEKMKRCVIKNDYKSNPDLLQISRHLRNAVAHSHLSFKADTSDKHTDQIKMVVFNDIHNGQEFIISIDISLLKEFLFDFSDAIAKLP